MWLKRSIAILFLIASTAFITADKDFSSIRMPYQQAGLTKEQAAAHLLNRFSFGIQPGQIEEVVKMGLENWLQQQLEMSLPETELDKRLNVFDALKMSNEDRTTSQRGFWIGLYQLVIL